MKRLTEEEYEFVYSRTTRLCIDLVIRAKDGLLLSKRLIPPFENLWHFPGGRVGYKETIPDAINRISLAEIGTTAKAVGLLGYIDMPNDGSYVHSVSLAFEVELDESAIVGSSQAKEFKAFHSLPDQMQPYQLQFLQSISLSWLK